MVRILAVVLVGSIVACAPHLTGFPDGSGVAQLDAPGLSSGSSALSCEDAPDVEKCQGRAASTRPGVPAMEHLASLYELPEMAYKPIERGEGMLFTAGAPSGEDLLVLPARDRQIRAVDTHTGEIVWSVETLGANVAAPIRVHDDIIVASLDGTVRRLSARNGRAVWKTEPLGSGSIIEAPAFDGERIFVTTTDNRLVALSSATGERLWDRRRPHRSDLTISGQAGPLVAGERVITGTSDGLVIAYAVTDGATDWSVNLAGDADEFVDVDATPILSRGVIVTAGYATGLVGLSAADGSVLWTVPGEAFTTPGISDDGILYAPQATGRLTAVEVSTGKVLWSIQLRRGTPSRPAVAQGYVLVPTEKSLLVCDAYTGRVRTSFDDGFGFAATPVVERGPGRVGPQGSVGQRVYLSSNSGRLYTLNF